jgi:hypothetical protein
MASRTGTTRYARYTRWTMAKCRKFYEAIEVGLPLKNAAGLAQLPYAAVVAYLKKGEQDAVVYYLDESDSAEPTLAGQFYLDTQEAIGKFVEKELKNQPEKDWKALIEHLRRVDPDAWHIVNSQARNITNVLVKQEQHGPGYNEMVAGPPGGVVVAGKARDVEYVEHVLTDKAWKNRELPAVIDVTAEDPVEASLEAEVMAIPSGGGKSGNGHA